MNDEFSNDNMDLFDDESESFETVEYDGQNFFILDALEHNGHQYLLLAKEDISDEDDEIESAILKVSGEEGDEVTLEEISDDELKEVCSIFMSRSDDFDIDIEWLIIKRLSAAFIYYSFFYISNGFISVKI